MAESKLLGYKKMFGFVLPDWVDEKMIKLVASGLFSVAVMFMVLIFVVWPNSNLVEEKKIELKANENALAQLEKTKNGLEQAQSDMSKKELENVLLAIPQIYSPENAIYMLRSISNDTGVSITTYSLPSGVLLDSSASVGTGKSGEMVDFSTFPIRITVAAPVDSLLRFIAEIEASLPFGVVSDLNLQEVTKLSKSISGKSVQLSLEIMFYQSNLRAVNINKVQPYTDADLTLAREISGYNILISNDSSLESLTATVSGSGSVFGF